MKVSAPFGFVTGCHAGDKFMVQATLASMRYYCPEVPICLIVDGKVDVSDLQEQYGLIVLRVDDLPSDKMRQLIAGTPRAKLAAMWEGPFEFYVWLDSDAIVWGDITKQIRADVDFQIFWHEISIPADAVEIPPWLPHFYFDPEKLKTFDPTFEWRGLPYFSDGVFACRRNAISMDEWNLVLSWNKEINRPWPVAFHCMPFINYLVHSKSQRSDLKVCLSDLQTIPSFLGKSEMYKDCFDSKWHFPKNIQRPRFAHFCGIKPLIVDSKAFSRPFTISRLEHHRRKHGNLAAWLTVLTEDTRVCIKKLML